jgi:hypothetical protein
MVRWEGLRRARPDLAEAGRALLYQHGVGLAFLATVRQDGGPRLHPFCPLLHEGGLFAFIVPSPKRHDLARDGRYAMHSFPADDNEDAFYVSGRAAAVTDHHVRSALADRYIGERASLHLTRADLDDQEAFEFEVTSCLLTRTRGHGDAAPKHHVWREPTTAES